MVLNEKIDLEYMKERIKKYSAEERVNPLLKHLHIL
jgi:hypothetical protein